MAIRKSIISFFDKFFYDKAKESQFSPELFGYLSTFQKPERCVIVFAKREYGKVV